MTFEEFEIQYALGSLDEETLIDLSNNTKSKKILTILSNDKDIWIRGNVAINPSTTTTKVLEILSNDEDENIRHSVAKNTNTPISTLRKLSNDKDEWVRRSAAKNLNWKKYNTST